MRRKALLAATLTNIGSSGLDLLKNNQKLKTICLLAAVALSGSVQADVAYTDGDPAVGKEKSATCAACHGPDGNSAMANFPKIAGQNARYTFKQLKDMKAGDRPVPEMAGIVANLSEQDMADLAAFYAEQKITLGAVDPELKELGQAIYRGGIAEREVPACIACHGPTGTGMASAGFPALSGQFPSYTEAQLAAFRAAARGDIDEKHRVNDGDSKIMRSAVRRMTDEEVKAVSSYVSGLH